MASNSRYKDLLDYTVSYRRVWTGVGLLVMLSVASLLAWNRFRPPSEDERARQDVKTAERLRERAEGCLTPETGPVFQERLQRGVEELTEARAALEARRWQDAVNSSRSASGLFKEFIDRVCAARDAVAHFVMIEGDVKVKKAQAVRWVDARPETALVTGDRIKTGKGVARIAYLLSEDVQTLGEGSLIEVRAHEVLANGRAETTVGVEHGTLDVKSTAAGGSKIETRTATILPMGDDVGIEQPEGGDTTDVISRRGGAEVVARDGARVKLEPLEQVTSSERGLSDVRRLLPGPELVQPTDGRFFTPEVPAEARTGFEWRSVSGARAYVFELGLNDVFLPVLNESDRVVDETEVVVPGLPPRGYYWRVATMDREGEQGPWSEIRRFTVRVGGSEPDRPPPGLSIVETIPLHDRMIVEGQTEPYVTLEVHINGRKYGNVDVSETGTFQQIVPYAREGRNEICFIGHDAYGTEARECTQGYFNPY